MEFDNMYTEDHWRELIEIIIKRVGVEQFILISMITLYKLGHMKLVREIILEQTELLDDMAKSLKRTKG